MAMDVYLNKVLDERYAIMEIIGTGGMAVVYKARDRKLNRLVAVKILKDELRTDAEVRRRFHAESEAVARLNHPNIINVFDVSTNPHIDYFVMELIDGITLKQYIKHRGVLSEKESLHFTVQILKALEHAHSKKIIHRDIKPQNIMILRDGTAKVTDFGIARIAGNQEFTINNQNAYGSVHYIAPEQARCEVTDGRADIYSVGVVLYEMLTGRLPFDGDSAVAVAMQHINSKPVPPRELNPEIPEGVESIVLGAMCADLACRYKSASEMLSDIDMYRADPEKFIPRSAPPAGEEGDTVRFAIPGAGNGFRPPSEAAPEAPKPRHRGEPGRPKLNAMPVVAASISLLVLIAMVITLWITIISPTAGAKDVTVPDYVGELYSNVIKDKSFEIIKDGEKYDAEYEAGVIIHQDIRAGTIAKSGSKVKVILSLGKRSELMPDYINMNYIDAQNDLRNLMERTVTPKIIFESSATIQKNYVIRTDPVHGQTILEGQAVTIYVSSGITEQTVPMPTLIGLNEQIARQTLLAAELIVGEVTQETNDNYDAGTVIWQSIDPEKPVPRGTTINFRVSKRSTPVTTTPQTEPDPDSVDWTFTLPDDVYLPEIYLVEVLQDGETIYLDYHTKDDPPITLRLFGSGDVYIQVKVDNEIYKEETIQFD